MNSKSDSCNEVNAPQSFDELPEGSLTVGDNSVVGKVHLEHDRQRGTFWPTEACDSLEADIPSADVLLGETIVKISDARKCPARSSDHWHFDLA